MFPPHHLSSMNGVCVLLATNKPLIILLVSVKLKLFCCILSGSGNRQIYLGKIQKRVGDREIRINAQYCSCGGGINLPAPRA